MKGLRIECTDDFFWDLETILFCQAFKNKPAIDYIDVELENGSKYHYVLRKEFGTWMIVTD